MFQVDGGLLAGVLVMCLVAGAVSICALAQSFKAISIVKEFIQPKAPEAFISVTPDELMVQEGKVEPVTSSDAKDYAKYLRGMGLSVSNTWIEEQEAMAKEAGL